MKLKKQSGDRGNDLGGAMTDISFLLIIFFLVTAVFVAEEGFFSYLPDDDTIPKQEAKNNVIQLEVTSDGLTRANEISYTDLDELSASIEAMAQRNSKMIAVINIGEGVSYGRVVKVIASVKAGGISDFTVSSAIQKDKKLLIPLSIKDGKDIGREESQ